jgi:hypothetical protein
VQSEIKKQTILQMVIDNLREKKNESAGSGPIKYPKFDVLFVYFTNICNLKVIKTTSNDWHVCLFLI